MKIDKRKPGEGGKPTTEKVRKLSREEVFKKMEAQRGKKFDPLILDAFYECLIKNEIPWRDFLEGKGKL